MADLLEGLAAADTAAALWMLRAGCYRHYLALQGDSSKAQVCALLIGWVLAEVQQGSSNFSSWSSWTHYTGRGAACTAGLVSYRVLYTHALPTSLILPQVAIKEYAGSLTKQWQRLAAALADTPDAYQLVLQEGDAAPAAAAADKQVAGATVKACLDAELLLRARRCLVADQPVQACESLLLLLERSIMKEQLAAGLIRDSSSSSSGGVGSSSAGGAAPKARSAQQRGNDEGTAAAEVNPWAKVRPLPPGAVKEQDQVLLINCLQYETGQ